MKNQIKNFVFNAIVFKKSHLCHYVNKHLTSLIHATNSHLVSRELLFFCSRAQLINLLWLILSNNKFVGYIKTDFTNSQTVDFISQTKKIKRSVWILLWCSLWFFSFCFWHSKDSVKAGKLNLFYQSYVRSKYKKGCAWKATALISALQSEVSK